MNKNSNKELIQLADSIYISGDSFSYYEFAANYLLGESVRGVQDTSGFFNTITAINNNAKQSALSINTKRALGIAGRPKESVKYWSGAILTAKTLREISLHELHYVMGYGARLCKIKNSEASGKDNKNVKPTFERAYMSTEIKKPEKPTTTEYYCSNCKKKVDIGETLVFTTKLVCPVCKKKVQFKP